jgi:DNA (cytosine-5)-methyltransferase 1
VLVFLVKHFQKQEKEHGFEDTRGTLFFDVERILKYHLPKYIILENVRNLVSHDEGNTWKVIKNKIKKLGYVLTEEPIICSPNQLGIPQLRERVIILGVHKSLNIKKLNMKNTLNKKTEINIFDSGILDKNIDKKYCISEYEELVLSTWNEFIVNIDQKILGFPIWADYFKNKDDIGELPKWKQNFIVKNRELYKRNKEFIDGWLKKNKNLKEFKPTDRKFEWQAGNNINTIWDGIIQFRPSGIRVKKPYNFPALVAMVQIPIIGKLKRRLTPRETARLQSFPDTFKYNESDQYAYKQFGNAVNVDVIEYFANQLFDYKGSE